MNTYEAAVLRRIVGHLKDRATRCRADAVSEPNVYYNHYLLGMANAFNDAASMITERFPEVKE